MNIKIKDKLLNGECKMDKFKEGTIFYHKKSNMKFRVKEQTGEAVILEIEDVISNGKISISKAHISNWFFLK